MKLSKILILCIVAITSLTVRAQNTTSVPRYDLVSYGTGTDNTYSAEIFVYLPKPDKDVDNSIRKSAVHGVIFKGLAAGNSGIEQRPMTDISTETKFADFFSSFFSDAKRYSDFVNVMDGTLRVEKVEKKLYRIRAIVSVQEHALRKYLEQQHVIESFNDLF